MVVPAFKCPQHGGQFANVFCEHVAAAINAREPINVYMQSSPYGWYAVCRDCVRKPKELHEAESLVCAVCITEWADATGSDYVRLSHDPVEEHPDVG